MNLAVLNFFILGALFLLSGCGSVNHSNKAKKIRIKTQNEYISKVRVRKHLDVILGAILRDNKIIIPRSNFIFKKKDRVVFIVKKDSISFVENIFRLSPV